MTTPPKKPRGRPPGSKNKPSSALSETRDLIAGADRRDMRDAVLKININKPTGLRQLCRLVVAEAMAGNIHPDTHKEINKTLEVASVSQVTEKVKASPDTAGFARQIAQQAADVRQQTKKEPVLVLDAKMED